MDIEKMKAHAKLCERNLKDKRVKCCAACPFESEITMLYPHLDILFNAKRKELAKHKR